MITQTFPTCRYFDHPHDINIIRQILNSSVTYNKTSLVLGCTCQNIDNKTVNDGQKWIKMIVFILTIHSEG